MIKKYLKHAGIKGQRWGVRRFQNEDGTLTEAGRRRYGKNEFKELEKDYKRADTEASKAILEGTSKSLNQAGNIVGDIGKNKSKVVNKNSYKDISDDELRSRINRLNMERSYGELTGDTKRIRSGADWTREILQTAGAAVGVAGTIAGIIYTIQNIKLGGKTKTPKGGL